MTYLCFTVVTVSAATLVVMFFAATSKPVHMVANPGQKHKIQSTLGHFSTPLVNNLRADALYLALRWQPPPWRHLCWNAHPCLFS